MNKKRLQVILSDDAWAEVEALTTEANSNFEAGTINYSDVINEMVLSAKVDIKCLQAKHTDIGRSLRILASKGVDIDSAIKTLMELKARCGGGKKNTKATLVGEPVDE